MTAFRGDPVIAMRPCANCGELYGGEWRWPLCDCALCERCAKGVVHACPACGAERLIDPSKTETGDYGGWQIVALLFAFAAVLWALGR